MKNLNLLFHFLLFPFVFLLRFFSILNMNKHSHLKGWGKRIFSLLFLFTINIYAANECSTTDHTGTLSSSNTTYKNTDKVYWHGGNDWNRKKYYIEVASAGHVEVTIINKTTGGNVRFNASVNSCPSWQGAGTSWSHDFTSADDFNIDVTPWTIKSGNQKYQIKINFTPQKNADLSINKSVNNTSPQVGDKVLFTILGTNNGNDKSEFKISDTLPAGLSFDTSYNGDGVKETQGGFSCSTSGQTATCSGGHNFKSGDDVEITIRAIVNQTGTLTNTASIESNNGINDPNTGNNSASATIIVINNQTPPKMDPIPNQTATVGVNYTLNLSSYAHETDGDPITQYNLTCLPNGLKFNQLTGLLDGKPKTAGTYNCSATAEDDDGLSNSSSFVLTVSSPPLDATDNHYNTQPGVTVSGNVITDDTGDGVDKGSNISVSAHTDPSKGSLTIYSDGSFTYTPDSNASGTDTFTYTITDGISTDTATVTIEMETSYTTHLGFELINPENTRNVIGDYAIAGNTVLCLTGKRSGYWTENECLDTTSPGTRTSNEYVSVFIDIDGDNTTWNSSSSNITLPSTYDQQGGYGILWAGLIWQGRFPWDKNNAVEELHYYKDSNTPVEIGNGTGVSNVTLAETNANRIQLKINNGSYSTVIAKKVYSYTSSGGITYSAIADVTSLLQSANLAQGKNTFTVSNLPTAEGREHSPGVYGGWSLVVIYAEDVLNGSPRNVSIYGGMDHLVSKKYAQPFTISGFKLPKAGKTVSSQLAIFSGEGELPYRPDYVEISENGTDWQYMPTNKDTSPYNNIFDAVMSGIDRDNISGHWNNLRYNNVGVDVDRFDLSDIISSYDRNITELYLRWYSEGDYIIPGMIAFSTELYKPNLCYDYTMDIDGYVIPSVNNVIQTRYGDYGDESLTTRVAIKSKEGDFALRDVNVSYRIHDINQLTYIRNSTKISPTGTYSYIDASAQTVNQSKRGFTMYIGKGSGVGQGGLIDAFETRYFKFEDKTLQSIIDTGFDLWVQYKVNYGSGDLTLTKIFTQNDICKNSTGYFPTWGIFNVSSDLASTDSNKFGEPYNLYTQVSSRQFNAKIFSYDKDYTSPHDINTTIEVEIFNADFFSRDTELACNNPDSNITAPVFVDFEEESHKDLKNIKCDFAMRNAGFRVWYLTEADGTFVNFKCQNRNDETCFRNIYTQYYAGDTFCDGVDDDQTENCTASGKGCYSCLRKYYGKPLCSRDNFAIRPEAFVTVIKDNNESRPSSKSPTLIASSKDPSNIAGLTNKASLVAGYKYHYDVNATSYQNDMATKGYIQTFNKTSQNSVAKMKWAAHGHTVSGCNKSEDLNVTIILYNGHSILNTDTQLEQVGNYDFTLFDSNWTSVDWYDMAHHTAHGFNEDTDCFVNNGAVKLYTEKGRQGCIISSIHTHPNNIDKYKEIQLRFYPYSFHTNLSFESGPSNNGIVYINTLDDETNYPFGYADRIDENISYNIQGTFYATSYTDTKLTNFVKNCYADNVDMTLQHIFHTPELTQFIAELRDFNTTDPSINIFPTDGTHAERITTLQTATAPNIKSPLIVNQSANNFEKSMKGAITMDLAFNFDRTLNQPLNPRYISFTDFNITDGSASNLSVELKTDYKAHKNISLNNQNITFVYARAKPNQFFYDNITENHITTPVSVVVYCDLNLTECQNRGLTNITNGLLSDVRSNEANWWFSEGHDANIGDGNITLRATNGTVTPSNPSAIDPENGIDNSVTVTNSSGTTPNIVNINLGPKTDRWLIYNKNANSIPSPFYRVRFIGSSGWTGEGRTGHVVGDDINDQKTRRLEW